MRRPWIKRIIWVSAIVVAFGLGLVLRGGPSAPDDSHEHSESTAPTAWTCSMHPQIQMPEPGQCPLCGMDLIPVDSGGGEDEGPRTLTLSETAQRLAEIQTTPVRRQGVEAQLRMVGKLEADESRVREISARVSGRIERLYIDYTGVAVRAGEKLFELYSPELYSAQTELIQAIAVSDELSQSKLPSTRRSAARTIEAVRERLRLWGITQQQIDEIEARGSASDRITIVAPMSGTVMHKNAVEGAYVKTGMPVYSIADLSTLWLKLDVYESDLAWVRKGQKVEFETDSNPGETFSGTVAFIDPMLNERSRSVKARINVTNRLGKLKPGMFARAVVQADVGQRDADVPLVIPASAPLLTGTRAIAYVADPERPGRFHGREVSLGPRAGDYYIVREGLEEGELVVSNGAFKIDSALQILAKKSMMNPDGGATAAAHQHGPPSGGPGSTGPQTPQGAARPAAIVDIPPVFGRQLDVVLAGYYDIWQALSRDEFAPARDAARQMRDAVAKVDASSLPRAAGGYWAAQRGVLSHQSDALANASDIEAARRRFDALSQQMIATVRMFGAAGKIQALVFHCPMAMDGIGANWLQPKPGTENPYYGASMFTCGSQVEALVTGEAVLPSNHEHR